MSSDIEPTLPTWHITAAYTHVLMGQGADYTQFNKTSKPTRKMIFEEAKVRAI